MSILCKIFGHQPLTKSGWRGAPGYAWVRRHTIDGLGVTHLYLHATCPRCHTDYQICNLHISGRITAQKRKAA